MGTNYQSGRSFEYRVKRILEDGGYYVVRSASSHGVFDLVAMHGDRAVGVQCKHNCGISIPESMSLLLCGLEFGIHSYLAWSDGGPVQFYKVTTEGMKEVTFARSIEL